MRKAEIEQSIVGKEIPITWSLDRSKKTDIPFLGYEGKMIESKVTGQQRLFYDQTKPFEKVIPYYNYFKGDKSVTAPKSYIIPQGWVSIIDRLKANNVRMNRIANDTTIAVESYKIENVISSKTPYEGHFPHQEVKFSTEQLDVGFRKGRFSYSR